MFLFLKQFDIHSQPEHGFQGPLIFSRLSTCHCPSTALKKKKKIGIFNLSFLDTK